MPKFTLPDDSIGSEPEPLPTSLPLDDPTSPRVLAAKIEFEAWDVSMIKERDILKLAADSMQPVLVPCVDQKHFTSTRMRLYRCKRQLLAKGNQQVKWLAFSRHGLYIVIKPVENLMSKVITDPEEIAQLLAQPNDQA